MSGIIGNIPVVLANSDFHKQRRVGRVLCRKCFNGIKFKRHQIVSLPGAPNYEPALGAKLLACPGRRIVSLPGAPNYESARGAIL